jgi:hypothetical protein
MKYLAPVLFIFMHALCCALSLPLHGSTLAPDCKNAPLLYPQVCGSSTAPSSFTAEFSTTAGNFTVQTQVTPCCDIVTRAFRSAFVCALAQTIRIKSNHLNRKRSFGLLRVKVRYCMS